MMQKHRLRDGKASRANEAERRYTLAGTDLVAPSPAPGLYIVATPIGNLGDITLRALEVLAGADLIACEDTRTTRILLDAYGISTRRIAYHEHNAERARPRLLRALASGCAVALVSDAGTPLVSDPGFRLVNAALAARHAVIPIPGASAALAALIASGLPSDAFLFVGFPPARRGARRRHLAEYADVAATLIVYESPKRLAATLADMVEIFGAARSAVIARELTKRHEEVRRAPLAELAAAQAAAPPPKGEIVILLAPPATREMPPAELDSRLAEALTRASLKDAVAEIAATTGVARRHVYRRALALRREADIDAGRTR